MQPHSLLPDAWPPVYSSEDLEGLAGSAVPQDHVEASRWFRLAAEQGHGVEQYNLAQAYDRGEGVPQNDVQAHKWANLSASRTGRTWRYWAEILRERVAERLTPDQRVEAQRLAHEWDEAHPRD